MVHEVPLDTPDLRGLRDQLDQLDILVKLEFLESL